MSTMPLQKAIETAKQNPDSEFAKKLRTMIESGQLDEASVKQNYDLSPFGRKKPEEIKSLSMNRFEETMQDFDQGGKEFVENAQNRSEKIQENFDAQESGERGVLGTGVRNIGQLFGAGADAIGTTFKTAMKLLLRQKSENKVKDKAEEVMEGVLNTPFSENDQRTIADFVQKYEGLKETNPKLYRDLDAGLGVANLLSQFIGVKGGTKVLDVAKTEAIDSAKAARTAVIDTTKGAVDSVKGAAAEVIPNLDRVVNDQVTKALQLSPDDIFKIKNATGNEVGLYLADKNLIKSNLKETTEAMDSYWKEQRARVIEEVSKVKTKYIQSDIPRYKDALLAIKQQVKGKVGLESTLKKVDDLLKKKEIVLNDIQEVKELMDDHFSLYKVTGDVGEGATKEGLANVRKELKEFIENEVKKSGEIDIAPLNNDVMTTRSIINAMEKRAPKLLTKRFFGVGDFAIAGGVGTVFSPAAIIPAIVIKKIIETPAMRLRFSKFLDSLSDARKAKILKDIEQGQLKGEVLNEALDQSSLSEDIINSATKKSTAKKAPIKETIPPETENVKSEIDEIGNSQKEVRQYKGKNLTLEEFNEKIEESFWKYVENTQLDEDAITKKLAKEFGVSETEIGKIIEPLD